MRQDPLAPQAARVPGRTRVRAVPAAALLALGATALPAPVGAQALPRSELSAIDVYRSDQVEPDTVRARIEDRVREALQAYGEGREAEGRSITAEIRRDLRAMGDFAFVDLSLTWYPEAETFYLTVDLVDADEASERMPFREAPTGDVADPSGLLAAWRSYEERGFQLLQSGVLSPTVSDCPALHCLWGFGHPELAAFQATFEEGVPAHRDALARVLSDDADAEDRAAAAYLLSHSGERDWTVARLVPALRDPAEEVRNNAMRVLAMIVAEVPEIDVPLETVLAAIDYPAASDRNKALGILLGLTRREDLRDRIAREAGPDLLRLLEQRQPNNHDPAYQVLRAVSGESFGDRDLEAWREWLASRGAG